MMVLNPLTLSVPRESELGMSNFFDKEIDCKEEIELTGVEVDCLVSVGEVR